MRQKSKNKKREKAYGRMNKDQEQQYRIIYIITTPLTPTL